MKNIKKVALFSFMILFAFLICLPLSKVSAGPVGGFFANPNWITSGGIEYKTSAGGLGSDDGACFLIDTNFADCMVNFGETDKLRTYLNGSEDLNLALVTAIKDSAPSYYFTVYTNNTEGESTALLDAAVAFMGGTVDSYEFNFYPSIWIAHGAYRDYEWNAGALPTGATVNGTPTLKTTRSISLTVNSLGDESDASAGDGVCASAGDGSCTLRAAIQEANSISQDQGVNIDFSVTGTISPASQLPSVNHDYISILGPGADNLNIDGTSAGDGSKGIFIVNNNNLISGLKIQNFSDSGIEVYGGANNNTISNNTISDNLMGIFFGGNENTTISNNIVSHNENEGVFLWHLSYDSFITSNTISENREGIKIENSTKSNVSSNSITGNDIGIYLLDSNLNNLISNTISSNSQNGISLNNSTVNEITSNTISSNGLNGIYLSDSNTNTISSNSISNHGIIEGGYWLAGVSTMKYGDVVYDAIGMNFGGGAITIPTILYAADFENNISLVSANSNTITNFIEAAGAAAGGFDFELIHVGDISVPLTAALPHGMIPNLATLELALGEGATAEALLQNVLTKSGDTWIYNGITNGVNGVVVETDGDPVTLASTTEPSLVHSAYGPYSGIVLDGTSSSNTLNTNIFTDNANGISFAGSADSNTVTGGSINSGIYNAITDTTDKTNTLNNVTFDRSKVQRTSGILIILPLIAIQITDLVATPGDGQIDLSWIIPDDGGEPIVDYAIRYRLTGSEEKGTLFEHDPFTGNTITLTGLINGTSYDFRIVAIAEVGSESEPLWVTATPSKEEIRPNTHHSTTGSYLPGYGSKTDIPVVVPVNQSKYTFSELLKYCSNNTNELICKPFLESYCLSYPKEISCKNLEVLPKTTTYIFTKLLKLGIIDNDVKELQKFLNTHGYQVSTTGAGSQGNETTKFGLLTQKALIKFQLANKISPAVGYFGPITRALVNSLNN